MESITDEDITARHRSPAVPISPGTGSQDQVIQVYGHSNSVVNRAPASTCTHTSPGSRALIISGSAPEARSAGLADIEQMLNDTYGSSGLSRSVQSRAPSSIERKLWDYAEHAEEHTNTAVDLNHRALGLLMESMENTKQAWAQAVHARQ